MSTPFPDPIIKPFSNSGDNAPPPLGPIATAANQETGFPILESTPLNAGGIPVTREEFNGAFNFYTKQVLALVSGCMFTFNQALSDEQGGYPLNAILYSTVSKSFQRSLVASNTANFVTTPSYINDQINWTSIYSFQQLNLEGNASVTGGANFFDPTTTRYVRLEAPTGIVTSRTYTLPINYPSAPGQALLSDDLGNTYWRFGGESRITYVQNAIVVTVGAAVMKFNTYYGGINFITAPAYYNSSTGVFTAPVTAGYKIEVLVKTPTTPPGTSVDVSIVDGSSNLLASFSQVAPAGAGSTPSLYALAYVQLTAGQTFTLVSNSTFSYGNVPPFIGNQFSVSWYNPI